MTSKEAIRNLEIMQNCNKLTEEEFLMKINNETYDFCKKAIKERDTLQAENKELKELTKYGNITFKGIRDLEEENERLKAELKALKIWEHNYKEAVKNALITQGKG